MDFEFKLVGEGSGRREAHRERVRSLVAQIEGSDAAFVVHDVSASGLALVDPGATLRQGRTCRLALAIGGKQLAVGLLAEVVRQAQPDREIAGLSFRLLSLRQEAWLDKLVLEIQKRRIDLRKALAAAENLEDEKKTDRADPKA